VPAAEGPELPSPSKSTWRGVVAGVQPRIDLTRSFDERSHSYLGYVLVVDGAVAGEAPRFTVRIGPGTQAKHGFRAGDELSGLAVPPADPARESADLYKASAIELVARGSEPSAAGPPWHVAPPQLPVYRERGHRRLDARTYESRCRTCTWGCRMAVDIIVDKWNPARRNHRFETFCYGPKSCPSYRAGATRKVRGRHGESWEEEDWVDEDAVAHRKPGE